MADLFGILLLLMVLCTVAICLSLNDIHKMLVAIWREMRKK
jgi:hypothetical protein